MEVGQSVKVVKVLYSLRGSLCKTGSKIVPNKVNFCTGNCLMFSSKSMSSINDEVVEDNTCLFQSVVEKSNLKNDKGNKKFKYSYEETIAALNGLQSNAALLAASEKTINVAKENLKFAPFHLESLGIKLTDLERLNAIHIAGTKGKGSTCALTECILRNCGFTTGFYSSPHLVSVRERIRLNGDPLNEESFIYYFWDTYTKIKNNLKNDISMPPYFHFLTLLAFRVFLDEKVDLAVVEVGVGGEYDYTNLLKSPLVVGITSIGIDHTNLLGNSLDKIAWQKSGIMKKGVPAFTVPQEPEVLRVFLERSLTKECTLEMSPPFCAFKDDLGNPLRLGMQGKVQEVNASLALQLCQAWIRRINPTCLSSKTIHSSGNVLKAELSHSTYRNGTVDSTVSLIKYAKTFKVPVEFAKALTKSKWPGRFQTIRQNSVLYFLDGAHTPESIIWCVDWFKDASQHEIKSNNDRIYKVLIFNCTKGRKPEFMLNPLLDCDFNLAIFSPNHVTKDISAASDQTNFNVDPDKEYQTCLANCNVWNYLQSSMLEEKVYGSDGGKVAPLSDSTCPSLIFECLTDAIEWLTQGRSGINQKAGLQKGSQGNGFPEPPVELLKANQVHILVTGSLHLVGGIMKVLDSKYGHI